MMRPRERWRVLLALALWLPAVLAASPRSEELTQKGLDDLKMGRFVRAIESFNAAVKADAKDLRPVFYQAVALNRLASNREAFVLLRALEARGFTHPEMDFEVGWSLMGMKRAKACVDRLERFEKAMPGRGQTSEFLGRCYLMLGALDKAEPLFREAVARDARLKPTVDVSMAALERARGNTDAARDRLSAAAQAQSPVGRALREQILPPAEGGVAGTKPWSIGLSATVGYNDNVIALGNTVPLPSDISRKGASFLRVSFNPQYTFRFGTSDTLAVGYALLVDSYHGLSAANLIDHYFYGDYRHRFGQGLVTGLRVADEETTLAGSDFRSQQTVRPAVAYKFSANTATEFAYQHAENRYKFDAPANFNRSGSSDTLELNHAFELPGMQLRGRVGYAHFWNHSSPDFTFSADTFSVALARPLLYQITGQIAYSYTRSRFDNPNSLSPSGATRGDDTHVFALQLARPINKTLSVFVQYAGTRSHSNIGFYTFDQNVTSAGIAARF